MGIYTPLPPSPSILHSVIDMAYTLVAVLSLAAVALAAPQQYNQQRFAAPRPFVPQVSQPVQPVQPLAPAPSARQGEAFARILKQEQDNQFDGTFNYAYETENGIANQAVGSLRNAGTDQEAQVITGSFAWTAPDGTPVTINFVADENGYRAEGDAIPTPPPVPAAIARALEYIRSLPPQPENQRL